MVSLFRASSLVQASPHKHEDRKHHDGERDDREQTNEPTEYEVRERSYYDDTERVPKAFFHAKSKTVKKQNAKLLMR